MDLQGLKAFYIVAQEKSFYRAAKSLHLTQPAISIRIANLESELGTELFTRKGKPVELTEHGKLLYTYTERILSLVNEVSEAILYSQHVTSRSLKIGTTIRLGTYILPILLEQFQKNHPGIVISLKTGQSDEILHMLENNLADVGFISEPVPKRGYHRIPLIQDSLVLVSSRDHLLYQKSLAAGMISLDELTICTMIHLDRDTNDSLFLKEQNVSPKHCISVDNIETIKWMVQRNLGVAFLSSMSVQKEINNGELVEIPFTTERLLGRKTYLVYPQKRYINPAVALFSNEVKDLLKENIFGIRAL